MSQDAGALASAEAQVAAVRDDPAARLALLARLFQGPTGYAPRHLPFRRAALSFMRWQAQRGVLNPPDASRPGSVWWRAMNERLLRDGCEAVGLLGGSAGEPSSPAIRLWLEWSSRPTGRNWYRAHNASIVGGYLEHRDLAEAESAPERFFMNVALARVLYAHALVGAPPLALGRLAPLGRLGDPRFGMAGVFLSLRRVLPNEYPLALDVGALPRRRAAAWPVARLCGDRAAASAAVRVVHRRPQRASPPGAGSRWQSHLRLAVRAAPRLAHSEHATRSPRARTCHARSLKFERKQASGGRSRRPRSADHTAKADVTRRGVRPTPLARRRAVAQTVVRGTKMRTALDHLARESLAALHTRRRSTARPSRRGRRFEPVGRPFPDVAGHVVDPVAVRREALDRRRTLVTVRTEVLPRKLPLPRIRHHAAAWRELLAPRERRSVEIAAGRVLPLRLGRERLARLPSSGLKMEVASRG